MATTRSKKHPASNGNSAGSRASAPKGRGSSSAGAADAIRFDAERCILIPVHPEAAILELEGRFVAPARRAIGRPRLVLTLGGEATEIRSLAPGSTHAAPDPAVWRASYAVPLPLGGDPDTAFSLAIGRSVTVAIPAPDRQPAPSQAATSAGNPQGEVEHEGHAALLVDLADARGERDDALADLEQRTAELRELRAERAAAGTAQTERASQPTWLEEVEAEATSRNGSAHHAAEDHGYDDEGFDDDGAPEVLPILAGRRLTATPTFDHEAVYEATLKRMQTERRERTRRKRLWLRLFALLVFIAAGAAIFVVVDGAVGLDIVSVF